MSVLALAFALAVITYTGVRLARLRHEAADRRKEPRS